MLRPSTRVFYRSESNQILETVRLLMEPLRTSHAAHLFASFQDKSLRFIGRPRSLAELEEKYRRFETHGPGDGKQVWLNWAAKSKASGAYIGWFQATIHDDQTTHLSYVVFPPHWRKGYSTEACREMIDHLIYTYRPISFVVEMDQKNDASVAMAEALGFHRCADASPGEYRFVMPAAKGTQGVS